ncbi:ATP-binding protein [Vagococcus martis]|uniref:ATP-binding protein n=1 Tax=Vagococcus martis TaxID=1768210 RepID=A0A1V4DJ05_9ENTE|nr:ATP-binding protein [Vagococcus martis]OPF88564.1 ATP-binding protein [Vagococcus martis]
MSDVISHKCPNCDGPLLFDPSNQTFHCEYCLSVFNEQDLDATAQKKSAENLTHTSSELFNLYDCPSCGAEIVTDDTTAATFCYYCHNPVVLKDRVSGEFLPNNILPFKISEDEAKEQFLSWAKSKKFIPEDFFDESQIEKITGIYFPYWKTDATTKGRVDATGTKITVWRVGETEYTRTRKYKLTRGGKIEFRDLIKNALQKNTKQLMIESVQPFPLTDVTNFDSKYLSGFQAEKRDLEFSDIEPSLTGELSHYTQNILENEMQGFTTISTTYHDSQIINQSNKYLLLPVWVVTYQSETSDEPFYYAMNGVTGKTSGKLPLNKPKLIGTSISIGVLVTLLILVGGYLLF